LFAANQDSLPPRLMQAARYAIENPDEIVFGTAAQIAEKAKTQPSTLVRLGQFLGFSGFSDMQEVFRAEARRDLREYRSRLQDLRASIGTTTVHDNAALLDSFIEAAVISMHRLRTIWPAARIDAAVQILGHSDTIFLLGTGRSFPLASYFAYTAINLGMKVVMMDHIGAAPEQIVASGPSDSLMAIGFAPYSPTTEELVRAGAARETPIVAISDSPSAPLTPLGDVVLQIADADFSGYRSQVASLCLADVLAFGAARIRG
jgi:DNA-binding MurR/RpiR family transcriptional regulator